MSVIYIELTQGKQAIVDQCNADLADLKWYTKKNSSLGKHRFYAARHSSQIDEKPQLIFLHRTVMERMLNRSLEHREYIDHKNGDGLDNLSANLRIANHSQNAQNRGIDCGAKSSKYKGVCWHVNRSKWVSSIRVHGITKHLGCFVIEMDAALAYDQAAELYFKDFAKLNFPDRVDDILRF